MRKTYCTKCKKYEKFIKLELSSICYKTLLHSSISNKCRSEDEKLFMEQESIGIVEDFSLMNKMEKYQNI